ncbi:MAG: Obg family GTPase CgtA, partial [Solirubrobacteraceae bacterium]
HVLDIAPGLTAGEGADPLLNYSTIERELEAHDERLVRLPRVLVLSKADLVPAERAAEVVAQWSQRLGPAVPVLATSSATGAGIAELSAELLYRVPAFDPRKPRSESAPLRTETTGEEVELAEHMLFRPSGPGGFTVEQVAPGAFTVTGKGIERLLARYDVDNEDAMAYLEGRLRKIGVMRALEAEGFQAGDDLEIAGIAFELDPEDDSL